MNSLTPAKLAEIRQLCEQGRKIDAIKSFREATGLGLKESHDAVEAIAMGSNLTPSTAPVLPASNQAGGLTNEKVVEIRRACADGGKILAIKMYREATGAGLKEAKEAVERIERNADLPLPAGMSRTGDNSAPVVTSGGCFGLLIFGLGGFGVWVVMTVIS